MKKYISILLVFLLAFSLVGMTYATPNSESEDVDTKDDNKEAHAYEVLKLSLQDAIEFALKNNKDVYIQELNVKKTETSYEQNKNYIKNGKEETDSKYEKALMLPPASGDQSINKKLLSSGAKERTLELNLLTARWNKEIKENQIKYDVEKAYYDLLQIEIEVNIAKESLDLAKQQYEQSKKMFELGTISSQQLLSIELAVAQAQSGYDAAQMGYELQKMNFNNTLGLVLDQKVILTDQIKYKEHDEINLEKAINEAFENNTSLKSVNENYELTKLMLQAIKVKYPENTYNYKEQEIAVEQAAKSLEMTKNGIEMGVRAAYLGLTTAEKQIATYELSVEKSQKALELAQISFELGQNTANDVTQARIELMNAKKNLSKQIHAYNMALLDFKYSTGLGKTLIGGGY